MQVTLIALGTALLLAGPQPGSVAGSSAESYTVESCLITLIEDVDVPAQEAGVLKAIGIPERDAEGNPVFFDADGKPVYQEVREGLEVSENQILGQIDDRMEQELKKVAKYKLQVAEKEETNTYSVQAAEAAEKVSEAEFLQAQEANRRKPGTVAPAELNRMLLSHRHAKLQWKQSEYDLEIAEISKLVRQAEYGVADLQLKRRGLVATLDGIVVERYLDEGEWVRPGDRVLRIIRMDRLRIEAFIDATKVSPAQVKKGQKVTVRLSPGKALPVGPVGPLLGEIVYVSPIVEAGPRFLVWAEVDNHPDDDGDWPLRPGLHADMTISLRPLGLPKRTAQATRP
ncbi:MAG: HlyD family efflux transporter periplasmic adaptor subunit [Planctomycetota bacterium]